MFKIEGKIKLINDEVKITDSFKKREFILEDNSSQYPQHISFQLSQDRCELIDNYTVDESITVDFNIRGREWTDNNGNIKYFNTFDVWRISKVNQNNFTILPAQKPDFLNDDDDDVLPF